MRMAGLCQFYWRTCFHFVLSFVLYLSRITNLLQRLSADSIETWCYDRAYQSLIGPIITPIIIINRKNWLTFAGDPIPNTDSGSVLSELTTLLRYVRSPYGMSRPSVVRLSSVICDGAPYSEGCTFRQCTRWGIITGPPSFKRHNLISTWFIYLKISRNIAEGMLNLQICKQFVFWLNVLC